MRRVGLVVFPGFQILDLVVVTVFEVANVIAGRAIYDVHLVSETGGLVVSSAGVAVDSRAPDELAYDTLMVAGQMEVTPTSPGLVDLVRDAARVSRRTASVCTGAFILAEAGLLEGRRATTHWVYARTLQRDFPAVRMDEDCIFIQDGPIWTSAGMTAAIDLSLALVEADLGVEISRAVARKMVVYHRRPGGQSQFSALLELEPRSDRIQKALRYARENLTADLSVERLAEVANLSPRQFSRAFHAETGQSPAKAVENLRLEAARVLMEEGRHPIEIIVRETGFGDRERMRRAFLRAFGQPPQAFQRMARLSA
ncbi:GlxA family transcriptional regulator [Nitrospirillum amazonense]|uniref:Transcriptional regulator GlxA family with amidase domain n=1 Tax=Nitrospirillum amazonense TaxID=28077 RepID=A0A560K2N6_9PROT|nr:GlxA family transcriptional regulator [Nitrospirillum amazonense]MDG3444048.1 GlxA family transcriptional regulator [Nitrospirillum amazonense]TWB77603.1 transcriptional regulator GlxA family with amidase domain [Nitrospirillum amazonense]